MKRCYVLERMIIGKWVVVDAAIHLQLTVDEAAWVNQSCRADYRWKTYE